MIAKQDYEMMTPEEAARWFRRSPSWLRQQRGLLRFGQDRAQPLFHVAVCRAFVLGRLANLTEAQLRNVQIQALASACKLEAADAAAKTRTGQSPASQSFSPAAPALDFAEGPRDPLTV
ncbi:MAG: hypothetical protein AB7N71_02880 [Phycisphaerae bacterium]